LAVDAPPHFSRNAIFREDEEKLTALPPPIWQLKAGKSDLKKFSKDLNE
jgi:hypothetical protein